MLWGWPFATWESIVKAALWTAAVAGVFTAVSAFVAAGYVGYELTDAVQRASDEKVAEAGRDASSAQAQAAKANERAATLERDATLARQRIAEAEARASEANRRTEELRAANLAIQEAIQPRRLGSLVAITSPDQPDVLPPAELQFGAIEKFVGAKVLIQVVNDFEAQILAIDIRNVTSAFGWEAIPTNASFTHIPMGAILEGVAIWYPTSSNLKDAADALADGFTKANIVGETSVITGGGITSTGARMPNLAQGFNNDVKESGGLLPYFDPPTDAVLVLVGMRPVSTVLLEGRNKAKLKP